MDEETRVRAFDQFYRSEQARRLAPDGSGVGLYAARGLVEAMGGSVSIESRLGRGTTIVIRLPAEPAGAESEGLAAVS
jgi:signal transduction histidine kinase